MCIRSVAWLVTASCILGGPAPLRAQGLGATLPGPAPQPGFFPGLPIPGTFSPNVPPAAIVPPGRFPRPVAPGLGNGFFGGIGFGGGFFYDGYPFAYPGLPFVPYYGSAGVGRLGGPSPFQAPRPSPPLEGAGATPRTDLTTVLSNQMPARLRVRLPVAGELWVNGEKQAETAAEFSLASPPAAIGTEVTFQIQSRWMLDRVTYQADRTVRVLAGDRSTLTVVSGDPQAALPSPPSSAGP